MWFRKRPIQPLEDPVAFAMRLIAEIRTLDATGDGSTRLFEEGWKTSASIHGWGDTRHLSIAVVASLAFGRKPWAAVPETDVWLRESLKELKADKPNVSMYASLEFLNEVEEALLAHASRSSGWESVAKRFGTSQDPILPALRVGFLDQYRNRHVHIYS